MLVFADSAIKLADIHLNTTDTLGLVNVTGNINVELDPKTLEADQFISRLKVKTFGMSFMKDLTSRYNVYYTQPIQLIHGSDISLPNFNQKKSLTEVVINEPKIISTDKKEYSFSLNYLRAFGEGASSTCQSSDSLRFKIIQIGKNLKLYYKDLVSPVTAVKLYMEALGSQKRLSKIEISASSSKIKIQYNKNCTKVN